MAFSIACAEVAGFAEAFFGRVAHQKNDEIVLGVEELEGGKRAGVVEVGNDKDKSAFAKGRIEREEFVAEVGLFAEVEVAKLMKPEKEGFAGKGRFDFELTGSGGEKPYGRYSVEASQRETAGDLHGELVFGQPGR